MASLDRRLTLNIVIALGFLYSLIIAGVAFRIPDFDPFSPVSLLVELALAGVFSVVGGLLYMFGSKRTTWKMMKSRIIGRYGRVFYLVITATLMVIYCLVIYVFVSGYFASGDEKDKQNLLIGLGVVGLLLGCLVFMYFKHVFLAHKGLVSRYNRHPPIFNSAAYDIPS